MTSGGVILVMLRQPQLDDPNEMRTDPFWEFGSFGCTGCHRKNLMNPKRLGELNGMRFGFVQNGEMGVKLVHVTPPITMSNHDRFGEARWTPSEMPLTYREAPTLVNNFGFSDAPALLGMISDVKRSSPVAQFSSKFRSRRSPLPTSVSKQLIKVYEAFKRKGAQIAKSYVDALPCPPPLVDRNRKATYKRLLSPPLSTSGRIGTRCRRPPR
ncbi:MAG: hypothetical protein Q8M26_02410 [Pseudolabrys sp.]|nr:hypothetical protein [Pseudolabrys sp.]